MPVVNPRAVMFVVILVPLISMMCRQVASDKEDQGLRREVGDAKPPDLVLSSLCDFVPFEGSSVVFAHLVPHDVRSPEEHEAEKGCEEHGEEAHDPICLEHLQILHCASSGDGRKARHVGKELSPALHPLLFIHVILRYLLHILLDHLCHLESLDGVPADGHVTDYEPGHELNVFCQDDESRSMHADHETIEHALHALEAEHRHEDNDRGADDFPRVSPNIRVVVVD
mmetsp:Transcript_19828/g.42238  ORF Transcript_19828/g.42238 Transcript_19828/m.42238 type:complete len:227 (-) Transcript_19828:163-843(-)